MTAVARLLLCHGAGAGCDSAFMQQLAAALQQQQIEVVLFEFAYMQRKRELGKPVPPPKVASLLPELAAAIKALGDDLPLFIGGKSVGGSPRCWLLCLSPQSNQCGRYLPMVIRFIHRVKHSGVPGIFLSLADHLL